MPISSASPRRAERNARLDPMGIYGTRSARRRQQLQRRRQWQNALLWLVGAAVLGFGIWWVWQPHPTLLRSTWTQSLPFRPATAPLISGDESVFLASQSGGLWRFSPQNPAAPPRRLLRTAFAPGAAPLISGQTIFWPGVDGILSVWSETGQKKWSRSFAASLVTRPALARTSRGAVVAAGDDSGQIAGFDAVSGAPQWKVALGGAAGEGIAASEGPNAFFVVPVLAGAASRGGLKCLDAQTGAFKWRFPADARARGGGIAAPVLSKNRVFWCNDEGAVVALDAGSGRKIWKNYAAPHAAKVGKTPETHFVTLRGAPVVVESQNIVAVGGNDGVLRAFDARNGAARWERNLGGPVRFAAQSLIFENQDALLTSGDTPEIFLLEAATGRILRRWTTPFPADFGVIAVGQQALALDAEGHLQSAMLR